MLRRNSSDESWVRGEKKFLLLLCVGWLELLEEHLIPEAKVAIRDRNLNVVTELKVFLEAKVSLNQISLVLGAPIRMSFPTRFKGFLTQASARFRLRGVTRPPDVVRKSHYAVIATLGDCIDYCKRTMAEAVDVSGASVVPEEPKFDLPIEIVGLLEHATNPGLTIKEYDVAFRFFRTRVEDLRRRSVHSI